MMQKPKKRSQAEFSTGWLQRNAIRLVRVHLALAVAFAIFIVASDAWGLVVRSITFQRWEMFGVLLMVCAISGYLARATVRNATYYRTIIFALILADLGVATLMVYIDRGMASRAVALYAIPIVSSAALLNRSALFGTATLATSAYVMAATRYFYVNFNEGYKAELYTTLGLYSAVFFVLAALIWVVLTPDKT